MNKAVRAGKSQSRIKKNLPFWLILPTAIILLIVQFYPAFYTAWLSFQDRTPDGWEYVGTDNFRLLFTRGLFAESIGHTIIFLVGYVVLTLSLGFGIAMLLKQNVRLSGVYITLLFIPWIIADIIAGLVFRLLVLPEYGLFTGILQDPTLFPPDGISVLTDPRMPALIGDFPFPPANAMIYLILAASWRALPFVTILILAALQTVPKEVVESARIDGASGIQLTRFITIPLILPTMVVVLFNLMLGGMNGVGMVFSLTSGGPGTTTYLLSYLLYVLGWQRLEFGQASALAILIAIVNWILIMGVLRITRVDERSV
ncbi:MAG: sugar ABC transporter permease [Anaerolineales bacterium]|nr:sugar ABC transporter permease [Anaerolineales bacterium]